MNNHAHSTIMESKDSTPNTNSVNKTGKESKKVKSKPSVPPVPNEGMNTPVPDHTDTHTRTENEKATYKQAENPLGDPDRE